MKFLKGLALSLLSFLLFLSISIFGTAFMLNNTLLDPDFVDAELGRLDVPSLAGELFRLEAPPQMPYLNGVIDETIAELEPWVNEKISTAIYSFYDYFLGKTSSLNLTISTEPVRETLRENLWEAFSASPPPELQGFSPTEKERYFNEFYQQFTENIPPNLEFTESSLPSDVLAILEQTRQALSYFQLGYKVLIAFMVLLTLGIILIKREVKGTTRELGIIFLTFGAIEYASILVAKYLAGKQMPLPEIPPSLQTWLPQFFNNLLAPLEMFSLGFLIGGIALLIVSFVYKPRQPSS